MKSCCLKWRKYSENINLKVSSTSNGKAIVLSKRATRGSKKSTFIKNQEGKGPYEKWQYNFYEQWLCIKCKKNTENIDPEFSSTSNGKAMILSKCGICGGKKSRIIKNQEAKGLLSNLGVRTSLSKVRILGDILF